MHVEVQGALLAVRLLARWPARLQDHQDADGRGKGRRSGKQRLRSGSPGRRDLGVARSFPYLRKARRRPSRRSLHWPHIRPRRGRRKIRQSREKQSSAPWTYRREIHRQDRRGRDGVARRLRSMSMSMATARPMSQGSDRPGDPGTALRDSLDFVNFNEFKNQIEWAAIRQGLQRARSTGLAR